MKTSDIAGKKSYSIYAVNSFGSFCSVFIFGTNWGS